MPTHWLDIDPIRLGDKNVYLYLTVLTKINVENNFLGLSSTNQPMINKKPIFK